MTIVRGVPLLALGLLLLGPGQAQAQTGNVDNPECLGSACGKPKEEGGGCGCGCGCSVWVAYTDDGVTLAYTDDADGDGRADDRDNCAFASNRDQSDVDGDQVGDVCDNCASLSNFQQRDTDGDGQGDDCDADADGDSVPNAQDNCPLVPNRLQEDSDGDSATSSIADPRLRGGDVCDQDDDNDGVLDGADTCPLVANPDQSLPADASRCRVDTDGDNVADNGDNCPGLANPSQQDADADGLGDVCDPDIDDDSLPNAQDNCPAHANRGQEDADRDNVGDACDARHCVVVDPSRPEDCLDPRAPFTVHAGGTLKLEGEAPQKVEIRSALEVQASEKVLLTLSANRNGAAIEYAWTVVRRPEGSSAVVERPQGAVAMSREWLYAYMAQSVPTFTPDVEGEYELQLQAKLAFDDRLYPEQRTSVDSLILRVGQDNAPGWSCAAAPASGGALTLGALLLGLLLRRRRPSASDA